MKRLLLLFVAVIACPYAANASLVEPANPARRVFPQPAFVPPPFVKNVPTVAALPPLARTERTEQEEWFTVIGRVRRLPEPVEARLVYRSASDSGAWAARITVAGAFFLRARIVKPDGGSHYWVCGVSCSNVFTSELSYGDELWTPMVDGASITLITDNTHPTFSLDAVAEVFARQPSSTSCFIDAACRQESTDFKESIAQLTFISGQNVGLCTGGLIIDRANKFPPYLLTARHCISSPAVASTVISTWDFIPRSCGGSVSNPVSLPHTLGSAIMASSDVTDVTLLKLSADPPGERWFMGWDREPPSIGTTLLRLSHPATEDATQIYAQAFSSTIVDSIAASCAAAPKPRFVYSQRATGGAGPGSSGAPAFDATGRIRGQLHGGCGPDPSDGCSSLTRVMDGSFAQSYDVLAPFLENGTPVQPTPVCSANSTTLCLNANRFSATVRWKDFSGNTGSGTAVMMTNDTGHFWFFSSSNVELVIKVLDGRGVNGKYWVFFGSLTSVEFTMTVRDSLTGRTRTYFNTSGQMASVGDTSAFDP